MYILFLSNGGRNKTWSFELIVHEYNMQYAD